MAALGPVNANTGSLNSGGGQDNTNSKKSSIQDLTIDLAMPEPIAARAPGAYRLRLINKIPSAQYDITSNVTANAIPAPIDLSGSSKKQPTPKPEVDVCSSAEQTLDNQLDAAMCETEVAQAVSIAPSFLKAQGCSATAIKDYQDKLTALTVREDTDALPVVADGDALDVTVSRGAFFSKATSRSTTCTGESTAAAPAGATGLIVNARSLGGWHFDFGKKQAQWLTYYGFNFAKSRDDSYYSKSNAGSNPASYTITAQANRQSDSFSPSVYLLRIPAEEGFKGFGSLFGWHTSDVMGGVTAGLGFDFSNPTVFLGYGVGWGYNVMITGGVVMRQVTRLKGQYNVGDTITTNLTPDQFVDSTYKPQAFIGLAVRLGSNPFSASSSKSSTTSKSTTGSTPSSSTN